jgi:hypothetical protein
MGNDDDGAPFGDLTHILLDDRLRLVIERARGFIEDENARIRH